MIESRPVGSSAVGRLSTGNIQRLVWLAAIALAAVLLLFGGIYYRERFLAPADDAPLDSHLGLMEQWVHDDPQSPEARLSLADTYLKMGRYGEALDQARQVLTRYPDHQDALIITGIIHHHLGQPEAALEPLERFVTLRKDGPMAGADTALEAAYYYLGQSYVQLDRPEAAIAALEAALAINRTDADALYQLGLANQSAGRPEAALEQFSAAVRFVPDFAEAYQGMAECYFSLAMPDHQAYAEGMHLFSTQNYDLARVRLEAAAGGLPNFAPVHLGLGLTYEQLGRLELSQAAINRALELEPGSFTAQHALGRIQAALEAQGESW